LNQKGDSGLLARFRVRAHDVLSNGSDFRLLEFLETLLVIAVIVCGTFTVVRTWVRIQSPFQMDYAEGTILTSSLRLVHGGSLYKPFSGFPYYFDPYPPFIYKLVSFVIAHEGLSFFYPRLLSLTAAIAACLFALILIHHWTQRWKLAVGFGLLPLTVAVVQAWLGIIRYDFIGIALTLGGLVVFVLFPGHRVWSLPFFVLAVAGLYPLVAAPAACCLYLWTEREKKKSLLFGACFAGALLAAFLCGQHASAGLMGYHLFRTQHSPYSASQLASFVQGFLRGYALLFLLSAVIVWKSIRERHVSLIAIYWFLVAGASLSLGKIGAGQNQMLHLVFAACISAAVAYDWIRQNSPGDLGLAVLVSTLILITMANTPLRSSKPIEALSECKQAYSAVREDLGDYILADNLGALVLGGKQIYVSDPFIYRWLVAKTGFPDEDLRQKIVHREFTAIVLDRRLEDPEDDGGRWPDDVRQIIRENYRLKEQFNCNDARLVYEPKDAP
jgi:hypothetical protein